MFQSLGLIIIFLLLISLFFGETSHNYYMLFLDSYLGKLFIFFYSLSLCYHMLNGVRHILWDIGLGFEIKNVYYSGYTIVLFTFILGIFFFLN